VQVRRICAGVLFRKGAAIRSPGRYYAGHGLAFPPLWVGGVPAMVFGVTTPAASPLLAASDARSIYGLTHPDAVRLFRFRVHTIDRGHSLAELMGLARLLGSSPPRRS